MAVATLAGAVVGFPGAPVAAGGATTDRAQRCTQVVHVGDSTTVGMLSSLPEAYADAGFTVHTSAGNGRGIDFRVSPDHETGLHAAQRLRRELAGAGQLCWVIALGTNDAAYLPDPAEQQRSIDDLLAVVDGDPVLWVNVYMFAPHSRRGAHARCDGPEPVFGCYGVTNMRGWNELLAATAAQHPNLTIDDWASVVRWHPDWFQSDGIHYTTHGSTERAHQIAQSARAAFA